MSIKTEYKCDRCGHTQDNQNHMWSVQISYGHGCFSCLHLPTASGHGQAKNWCRKCMEVLGILLPTQKIQKEDVLQPSPTLEDLIREIVKEEVSS